MLINKMTIFWMILFATIISQAAEVAPPKAIPVSDFQATFSKQFALYASPGKMIVQKSGGVEVLRIRQDANQYYASAGIRLDGFKGGQGLFVGVDIKTVDVAQFAGVYYTGSMRKVTELLRIVF